MLSLKFSFDGERRRVQSPAKRENLTFNLLVEVVQSLYDELQGKVLYFTYKDDENETITLSSEKEFQEALLIQTGKLVKFRAFISKKQPNATPKKTEPQAQAQVPEEKHLMVHRGVSCDECNMYPIIGVRYQCTSRTDYDLCQGCNAKRIQPFPMKRIETPIQYSSRSTRLLPTHTPAVGPTPVTVRASPYTQRYPATLRTGKATVVSPSKQPSPFVKGMDQSGKPPVRESVVKAKLYQASQSKNPVEETQKPVVEAPKPAAETSNPVKILNKPVEKKEPEVETKETAKPEETSKELKLDSSDDSNDDESYASTSTVEGQDSWVFASPHLQIGEDSDSIISGGTSPAAPLRASNSPYSMEEPMVSGSAKATTGCGMSVGEDTVVLDVDLRKRWEVELAQLGEMGFNDEEVLIPLLQRFLGEPGQCNGASTKNVPQNKKVEGMQAVLTELFKMNGLL